MANKTYHIVGTILKANRITIETDTINTINTHIHDRSEKLEHPKGEMSNRKFNDRQNNGYNKKTTNTIRKTKDCMNPI